MTNDEQQRESWRQRAKEVAKSAVAPRAAEIDIKGEFPQDIAKAFFKNGILNLLVPKDYGGGNADITSYCIVVEEIAYYCVSSSLFIVVQAVGSMPIILGGGPDLKGHFLRIILLNE